MIMTQRQRQRGQRGSSCWELSPSDTATASATMQHSVHIRQYNNATVSTTVQQSVQQGKSATASATVQHRVPEQP